MSFKAILRHLIGATTVSTLIVLAFVGVNYAHRGAFAFTVESWRSLRINFVFSFGIYVANAFAYYVVQLTVADDTTHRKRTLVFLPISILATVLFVLFANWVFRVNRSPVSLWEYLQGYSYSKLIIPVMISLIVIMGAYGLIFYRLLKQGQIQEQKLIAEKRWAELEVLKSQLDPHFLFNSLNVLTGFIQENPSQAEAFTRSLSKIYRYVLQQRSKDWVPLTEEIEFAQLYMQLMKLRFEDYLEFQIGEIKPSELDSAVLPMALQILLENAFKHNRADAQFPLQIFISVERNYLVVSNRIYTNGKGRGSSGLGLKNIVSRYQMLTSLAVFIGEDGGFFTVKLPLLSNPLSDLR